MRSPLRVQRSVSPALAGASAARADGIGEHAARDTLASRCGVLACALALTTALFGCDRTTPTNRDRATHEGPPPDALLDAPATRRSDPAPRWDAAGLVGRPAPPLAVERWFQGRAEYADAPTTLLVLCEIWAPRCKDALPRLAAAEADYARAGVKLVGLTRVTKSATDEAVTAFLRSAEIDFPFGKEDDARVSLAIGTTRPGAAVAVQNDEIVWAGWVDAIPSPNELAHPAAKVSHPSAHP